MPAYLESAERIASKVCYGSNNPDYMAITSAAVGCLVAMDQS